MIRSSRTLMYVGKYFFLVPGIILMSTSLYHCFLGIVTSEWAVKGTIASAVTGTTFLMMFNYLRNKVVVVELGVQKLIIHRKGNSIETDWLHVESIERLLISSPPVYIIRLIDVKGYFIFFNSESSLLWTDDSEMGDLIRKRKKELDI